MCRSTTRSIYMVHGGILPILPITGTIRLVLSAEDISVMAPAFFSDSDGTHGHGSTGMSITFMLTFIRQNDFTDTTISGISTVLTGSITRVIAEGLLTATRERVNASGRDRCGYHPQVRKRADIPTDASTGRKEGCLRVLLSAGGVPSRPGWALNAKEFSELPQGRIPPSGESAMETLSEGQANAATKAARAEK